VLDRFYQAAILYSPKAVVRITADCPLIDPEIVDRVVEYYQSNTFDYVANRSTFPVYPDGLDTEIFSLVALKRAWQEAKSCFEREHVTPYIRRSNNFRLGSVNPDRDYSEERWTVDYEEDFLLVEKILKALYVEGSCFGMEEILAYEAVHPEVFEINRHLVVKI
jgi:spore coat polysaccharide biosynthesis protein SpsF